MRTRDDPPSLGIKPAIKLASQIRPTHRLTPEPMAGYTGGVKGVPVKTSSLRIPVLLVLVLRINSSPTVAQGVGALGGTVTDSSGAV